MAIYNSRGCVVKRLVNEAKGPGSHEVFWDGTNERGEELPSGIYLYMLKAGRYSCVKKMVLMK
jgi:flagellar hook assembly protein FlgD